MTIRSVFRLSVWMIVLGVLYTAPAFAEEIEDRFCVGLLWCIQEKEGDYSVDALFSLYSYQKKERFSRLAVRPFYSHEIDKEVDSLRRSVLWPLGTYERKREEVWLHVAPLYWHSEEPTRRFTLALPFYLNYEKGVRPLRGVRPPEQQDLGGERGLPEHKTYFHLFPVYGRHTRGASYQKNFFFGPLLTTTYDSEIGLSRQDILYPLFSHRTDKEGESTHLLPLYFSGYDQAERRRFRYLLPFYGYDENVKRTRSFLFPLYGFEETKAPSLRRTSLLGLPPISSWGSLPTLSLYEHTRSEDGVTDRFFPVHRYENEMKKRAVRFSLIGYKTFSLFWYDTDPGSTRSHFFPLYSYEKNKEREEDTLGLFGHGDLSFYRHQSAPALLANRLFPLYDYREEGETHSFSLVGVSEFALYRHVSSPTLTSNRLSPFYRYRRDRAMGSVEWEIALLYNHLVTPTSLSDYFFPLYHYERDKEKDQWQIGILGVPPFSIYSHHASPSLTTDHLFLLYGYRKTPVAERRFSLLGLPPIGSGFTWALFEHTKTPSVTAHRLFPLYRYLYNKKTDTLYWDTLFIYQHHKTPTYTKNVFLPIHSYENDLEQKTWQIGFIGVPPLTLFRHKHSPEKTTNFLFPLYSYQNDIDGKKIGLLGYDSLSLYLHQTNPEEMSDRLFPLYRYSRNTLNETHLNILLFYNHKKEPEHNWVSDFLFPIYSFEKKDAQLGFSMIGFKEFSLLHYSASPDLLHHRLLPLYVYQNDRIAGEWFINSLLLYEHRSTPNSMKDRLFPIYDYHEENNPKGTLPSQGSHSRFSLSLLGVSNFSFYRHEATPTRTYDRIPLLYRYSREKEKKELQVDVLGISPLSLYQHRSTRLETRDRLFPLYSYESDREKKTARFSLLGLPHWSRFPTLSLYEHTTSPQEETDRFFPLYRYSYERMEKKSDLEILFLFRHQVSPVQTESRFFPFYSYEAPTGALPSGGRQLAAPAGRGENADAVSTTGVAPIEASEPTEVVTSSATAGGVPPNGIAKLPPPPGGTTRIGVLGWAPFSLYQHLKTDGKTSDRFIPFYSYSFDHLDEKGDFSILWPLFNHKSQKGKTMEVSLLWWLLHYEQPREGEKEFRFLGGSAMAVLRKKTTPTRSFFEFNPILPFYSYESEEGKRSEWNLFGGLIGMRKEGDTKKVRLFFVYL